MKGLSSTGLKKMAVLLSMRRGKKRKTGVPETDKRDVDETDRSGSSPLKGRKLKRVKSCEGISGQAASGKEKEEASKARGDGVPLIGTMAPRETRSAEKISTPRSIEASPGPKKGQNSGLLKKQSKKPKFSPLEGASVIAPSVPGDGPPGDSRLDLTAGIAAERPASGGEMLADEEASEGRKDTVGVEEEASGNVGPDSRRVEQTDFGARVYLKSGQSIAFDGCAMVKLVIGRASVLGYQLLPSVETLICCAANSGPAISVEAAQVSQSGSSEHSKREVANLQNGKVLGKDDFMDEDDDGFWRLAKDEAEGGKARVSRRKARKSEETVRVQGKGSALRRGLETVVEQTVLEFRSYGERKVPDEEAASGTLPCVTFRLEGVGELTSLDTTEGTPEGVQYSGELARRASGKSQKTEAGVDQSDDEEDEDERGNDNGRKWAKLTETSGPVMPNGYLETGRSLSTKDAKRVKVVELEGEDTTGQRGGGTTGQNRDSGVTGQNRGGGVQNWAQNVIVIPDSWRYAVEQIAQSGDASWQPAGPLGAGACQLADAESAGLPMERQVAPPIVVVCGPKNAGKSTFGQVLVNGLLGRYLQVAYLETDVGQPEFTIPGCLSLNLLSEPVFGPAFLHLRNPHRCHFFGDVSPKADPETYLRCVVELYDYFRQHLYQSPAGTSGGRQLKATRAGIPLVVNTHGWIKGLGLDVLVDMLRYMAPTHVVQLVSPSASKNLPLGAFWELPSGAAAAPSSTQVYNVNSAMGDADETRGHHRSPADSRSLRILAFLAQATGSTRPSSSSAASPLSTPPPPLALPLEESRSFREVAQALMHCCPFQVPISAVEIMHLHMQVPASESLYAVNGAIVGLAVPATGPVKLPGGTKQVGLPLCVGVGLVRSADAAKGVLYVLTNVPIGALRHVTQLLHGRIEVPSRLLQVGALASPYFCRNSIANEGTGAAAIRSRGNLSRRASTG